MVADNRNFCHKVTHHSDMSLQLQDNRCRPQLSVRSKQVLDRSITYIWRLLCKEKCIIREDLCEDMRVVFVDSTETICADLCEIIADLTEIIL